VEKVVKIVENFGLSLCVKGVMKKTQLFLNNTYGGKIVKSCVFAVFKKTFCKKIIKINKM